MSSDWLIQVVDGVAVVTMNSNKANTIDGNFVQQVGKMLDKLETDPALNTLPVVITGHGAYFSAGFDLKAFAAGNIDAVGGLFGYMLKMLTFPRPLIAAGPSLPTAILSLFPPYFALEIDRINHFLRLLAGHRFYGRITMRRGSFHFPLYCLSAVYCHPCHSLTYLPTSEWALYGRWILLCAQLRQYDRC